jgi:hypothetical protein
MVTERRQTLRRETDREMGLDRDDLFLLLESYKNTIELNTTLLERQEALNTSIERILGELVKICGDQAAIAADIGKLPGEIRDLIEALCAGTADRCEDLKTAIDDHRKEEAREHSAHALRIYGAFGILGTLTIALVGLLVKIWPTLNNVPTTGP